MTAYDYSILYCRYEIALFLKGKGASSVYTEEEYITQKEATDSLYVNYKAMISDLNENLQNPSIDYLEKPE